MLPSGEPGYRVLVCGTEPVVSAGPMRIATDHGVEAAAEADTIVVPGRNDVTIGTSTDVLRALKSAHAAGTRIASICSGAFTLAEAGLLDGKRATTHWLAADFFRASFPAVDLDPDVLYVDEGQVLTSAGRRPAWICACTWSPVTTAPPSPPAPLDSRWHRCTAAGDRRSTYSQTPLRPSTLPNAPNSTMCWRGLSRSRIAI